MEAVALFATCNTQWRYAFSGVRIGLDYAGVEAVIRLHELETDSETFSKLQILEHALIKVDRDNHAKD